MSKLVDNVCEACNGLTPKVIPDEISGYLVQLQGWQVLDDHLQKRWKFSNFAKALKFVNEVGVIADQEGHHPDISFGWGYVEVSLTTHAIKGLSKNDFIVAAKIDTCQT